MKKILTILGACVLLFGFTVSAQAVTLGFESPAMAPGDLFDEQYWATDGMHQVPNPLLTVPVDGYVYASGAGPGGNNWTAYEGSQYIATGPTGGGGVVLEFYTPVQLFTMKVISSAPNVDEFGDPAPYVLNWFAIDASNPANILAGTKIIMNSAVWSTFGLSATQLNVPVSHILVVDLDPTHWTGMDAMTFTGSVPLTAPVAAFIGVPTTGDAPLTVDFTDQSTNTPDEWSWDFGDTGTSALQNPSHEYLTPGTYTVTLTATNTAGSDQEIKTNYITVTAPTPAPVAAFIGVPTTGDAPLTVDFTDQSSNTPTSWSWDFGDGGTSTAQDPSHEYLTPGTYTVTLTATNAGGSDQEIKTDYITVTGAPPVTPNIAGPILLPLLLSD